MTLTATHVSPTAASSTASSSGEAPLVADDITVVDQSLLKRAVSAMAIGNAMEWFDFGVYSYIAVTLGKVFFPSSSPSAQLLATFGTFAAAFLVRPLGGMVFGPLGDRIGRQRVLAATMIMMAVGTFAIGLIPSYASIGIMAPVLLLVARLVQGFSTGGEYGGAATFIAEFSTDKRRGFMGSFLEFGTLIGYVMGAGVVALLTASLSQEALLSWGWRVPFLASIALVGLGWFIRAKVPESPDFEKMQRQGKAEKSPVTAALRRHPREVLTIVGARAAENTWFYMVVTFALAYATQQLHLPKAEMLHAITAGAALSLVTMPLCGHLSDRIGQRRMFAIGLVLMCAFAAPFFLMLGTQQVSYAWWAIVLGLGVVFPILYAPESLLFAQQFPAEIRYSGISLSVQLAGVIGGGFAPMIATSLLKAGGGQPHYVIAYLVGFGVFALMCTALMRPARA